MEAISDDVLAFIFDLLIFSPYHIRHYSSVCKKWQRAIRRTQTWNCYLRVNSLLDIVDKIDGRLQVRTFWHHPIIDAKPEGRKWTLLRCVPYFIREVIVESDFGRLVPRQRPKIRQADIDKRMSRGASLQEIFQLMDIGMVPNQVRKVMFTKYAAMNFDNDEKPDEQDDKSSYAPETEFDSDGSSYISETESDSDTIKEIVDEYVDDYYDENETTEAIKHRDNEDIQIQELEKIYVADDNAPISVEKDAIALTLFKLLTCEANITITVNYWYLSPSRYPVISIFPYCIEESKALRYHAVGAMAMEIGWKYLHTFSIDLKKLKTLNDCDVKKLYQKKFKLIIGNMWSEENFDSLVVAGLIESCEWKDNNPGP